MSNVSAGDLLALATTIGEKAGELLMERPPAFAIETKSTAIDIATQMDVAAEKFIVESILAARPGDGIIGEEGSTRSSSTGITWVIDPLDGTVNYVYGMPGWNVSIGVKDETGVLAGVVVAPTINSMWRATRGGGAFFNGAPISVNDPIELDRALIATGFQYDTGARHVQLKTIDYLVPRVRDIRRNGAAAVDLCYVAMGAVDGYFEDGLKEWDYAAGGLIAREAGAILSHEGVTTVAAGPHLHQALLAALRATR